MELPAFDAIDFKKFTDGKTIVKVSNLLRTSKINSLYLCEEVNQGTTVSHFTKPKSRRLHHRKTVQRQRSNNSKRLTLSS